MKKQLLLFATMLTVMFNTTFSVMGQDFVKEAKYHKDNYSVIHEMKQDVWLVSDYHPVTKRSYFSRFLSDTCTLTDQLELYFIPESDSLVVRDFKIYRDTVFFCGQVWFDEISRAFWGYFPLAGFPNTSVVCKVRSQYSFDKLEVFSVDPSSKEIHVVMIGREKEKMGVVVDERRTSPGHFIEYISVFEENVFPTDLIQTDNYVVFARYSSAFLNSYNSNIVSIAKPTTTGISIFANTANQVNISYLSSNSIYPRLEHCVGDKMVVAYKEHNVFRVIQMIAPTNVFFSCNFGAAQEYLLWEIKDIGYDKDNDIVSLLNTKELTRESKLYELLSSSFIGVWACHVYHYPSDELSSLEYLMQSGLFIASGRDNIDNILRIYRYHSDTENPLCANYEAINTWNGNPEWNYEKQEFISTMNQLDMIPQEAYDTKTPVEMICQ